MATLLQTAPVSNPNNIQMFEEDGVHLVQKHLPMLAKLFVDYKMNEAYGIGYLHRHFDIPKSSIWVHEQVGDEDRVVPKPINSLNMSDLQGHSFCLENGEFKAFEFEDRNNGARQPFDTKFLSALKDSLQQNKIEDIVALCPREKEPVLETLLPGEGGTSATPRRLMPVDEEIITEPAQWCFNAPSTTTAPISVVPVRDCRVNRDGFHFVNGDSEASQPTSDGIKIVPARDCRVNRDGFHFVNGDSEATQSTSDGIKIVPVRDCRVNRDGFHFVNGDSATANASSKDTSITRPVTIVPVRDCRVNRDGFHFVNGDKA